MQGSDYQRAFGLFLMAGGWLWHFFSSVRLAVSLMLALIGFSLIGALLIQVPTGVAHNSAEYAWWLEHVAQPKVGAWVELLASLQLFDVFHSPWFLGIGVLLVANIVVCNLKRWRSLRRATSGSPIRQPEEFYLTGTNQTELPYVPMAPSGTVALSSKVLKRHRYRVRTEHFLENVYIAADKNRYSRFGTYLSHLSIIILILGFLLGSYLGFCNRSFIVPEGMVGEVGYGTGLSLRLESFVDEYWPEGIPKDYRSQVVIYEDGEEVKRGTIRVNHPMNYEGIRFYQSFFGPAVVVQVRAADGKVLYKGSVALSRLLGSKPFQRPGGRLNIAETGLTAYLVAPVLNHFDPVIAAGQVGLELYRDDSPVLVASAKLEQGVPSGLAGLEFTFLQEGKYSGFQVSRDPGNKLIWIASGLFVLGIGMVFYFPHRQLWVMVQPRPGGESRLFVRTSSRRSFGVALEFQSLINELNNELAGDGKTSTDEEL